MNRPSSLRALARSLALTLVATAVAACSRDPISPPAAMPRADAPVHSGAVTLAAGDGTIAFTASAYGFQIHTMDPDGSGVTQVSFDSVASRVLPQISPDGTKIVFQRAIWQPVVGETSDIYVMNADGTGLTNLTNSSAYQDEEPTWSPDGSKIAFKSNRVGGIYQIHVMDSDGTDVTQVTFLSGTQSREPTWSPDGTQIAFTTDQSEAAWLLCIVTISGGGTSCTTDIRNRFGDQVGGIPGGRVFGFFNPEWGPGGRIAVSTNWGECSGCSHVDIFLIDPDFTDFTQLTAGAGQTFWYPSWSPDGTQIAYQMNTGSGTTGIGVMNADGTSETIVLAGQKIQPDWGPDVNGDPPSSPQCADGEDNDGDGRIDSRDPGCSGSNDDSESPDPVCNDGIDNDGDGWEDYPFDPGCSSSNDNSENPDPALSCSAQTDRVLALARQLPARPRLLVETAVRGALAWERLVPGWGHEILEMNRAVANSSRFGDRVTIRVLALLDDFEESCL